jgi:plastocyanin domain-containing protein
MPHQIQSQKKPLAIIIVAVFLSIIVGGYVFITVQQKRQNPTSNVVYSLQDGTQVVEIFTKGGFNPSQIEAKAGVPTVLRFRTNSTFDCSAALNIPSLNIQQTLPPTAQTDIPITTQSYGAEIVGGCSGGSYGFKIVFI